MKKRKLVVGLSIILILLLIAAIGLYITRNNKELNREELASNQTEELNRRTGCVESDIGYFTEITNDSNNTAANKALAFQRLQQCTVESDIQKSYDYSLEAVKYYDEAGDEFNLELMKENTRNLLEVLEFKEGEMGTDDGAV